MKMRIAVTVLLLVQLSCTNDDVDISSFNDDTSITTLNGTWRVTSFENFTTGTAEHKTQNNSWDKDIIVTFDDTKNPRELSGTNITNKIHGKFDYVGDRQLRMSNVISTYAAQPEWADKFTEAIGGSDLTFKINSEALRIYYDNNTNSVTLTRQ
jgi:hypothetical protein